MIKIKHSPASEPITMPAIAPPEILELEEEGGGVTEVTCDVAEPGRASSVWFLNTMEKLPALTASTMREASVSAAGSDVLAESRTQNETPTLEGKMVGSAMRVVNWKQVRSTAAMKEDTSEGEVMRLL